MGKAQSKRSVDITTDPKKDGTVEEGTGEMKKIEDVDQLKPQVNGDTQHNENENKENTAENGETENEKDLSTEKEKQKTPQDDASAGGDIPTGQTNTANDATATITKTPADENKTTEANETLNDSKTAATPATDTSTAETPEGSSKKSKKKKWSFRSISFGKKDKQKPSKKEETVTTAVAEEKQNGESDKCVPEETNTEEIKATEEKKDESTPTTEIAVTAALTNDVPKPDETKPSSVETDVKVENLEKEKTGEVVTNGTATETKSEEVVVEEPKSTSDEIVNPPKQQETAVPVVVETVETTSNIETNKTAESLTNGHDAKEEEPKLTNGSAESPKIEVKCDEIITTEQKNINEKLIANTEKNENISVQNETEKNIISDNTVVISDKDDENETLNTVNSILSSSSSPPPPLPCSPPPSQVMVFALSETKQDQAPIVDDVLKSSDEKENKDSNIVEKIETIIGHVLEKTSDPVESLVKEELIKPEAVKIDLEHISEEEKSAKMSPLVPDVQKVEVTEITLEVSTKPEDILENKAEQETTPVKIEIDIKSVDSSIETIKVEMKDIEVEEKITDIEPNKTEELVTNETENNIAAATANDTEIIKQEDTMSTAIFDNNINGIVETITLIEELKDAVETHESINETETTKQDTNENIVESIISNENKQININELEDNQNATMTTATEIEMTDKTEDDKHNELILNQDLPTASSPSTKSILNEDSIIRENKSDKIDNIENLQQNNNEISEEITAHIEIENKKEIEESESERSTTADESASELTESITSPIDNEKKIVLPSTETTKTVESEETEIAVNAALNNAPTNTTSTTTTDNNDNKKENGVENDEIAEKSATESVNGIDHKIIEDIKAENQQIEKVVGTDVVTQGATATAAVAE